MQLKALPGQPVCKHSVSMCFGRAPAPRAHSKLQQGRRGCAPAAAPAGPRWTEVGGYGRAPSRPSPAPQGQGWGQADGSFILSSILSGILVATHGFSWLLRGPSGGHPGREAREVPEAEWLGISLAGGVYALPPAIRAPGRPAPPAGLLWSQRWVLPGFISRLFSSCG